MMPHIYKRPRLIKLLLFIILISIGLIIFIQHPYFKLTTISFHDNNFISTNTLTQASQPFINKNSIITYYTQSLEKHLLTTLPKLNSAQIKMHSTSHFIIQTTEKAPWISILSNNKSILVAKDGTILSTASDNTTIPNLANIVIIRGIPKKLITKSKLSKNLVTKISTIITSIQKHFKENCFQLEFQNLGISSNPISEDKLNLLKEDTLPIKIGPLNQLDIKFKALKSFLSHYDRQKDKKTIQYIDVRIPKKVIVKYE